MRMWDGLWYRLVAVQGYPGTGNNIANDAFWPLYPMAMRAVSRVTGLPEDVSGYIVCDRNRVMQVLSNLIGNAMKFSPAKGQICVSCARSGNEGKEVQISVSDTGEGISPEKIKTIFERFSQLHNQDRRGIGLGLYIAKMMVEEHPGRLWVESKVGEGSTFHFTLPLRSAHQ